MDPKENAKTTEETSEEIKNPLSDEELDQVSGAGEDTIILEPIQTRPSFLN